MLLVSLERMKASGIEAGFKSKDIEVICGHPTESYTDYSKYSFRSKHHGDRRRFTVGKQ
jgi:hypothetical protein